MKMKFKNKLFSLITVVALLIMITGIVGISKAAGGSATITLSASAQKGIVGKKIDITVGLKNVVGAEPGIAGVQGNFIYDHTVLNCTSSTPLTSNYFKVNFNPATNKLTGFAGSDSDKIPGSSFGLVKITCDVIKAGSTDITVTKHELSAGDGSIMTSTVETLKLQTGDASTNANLKSLGITGQTLTPAFNKDTLNYNVTVPNSVARVTITAAAEDANARVSGTGGANVNVGTTPLRVTVTAEDGKTTKTYTINLTREAGQVTPPDPVKSNDNDLKSLSVSGYNMVPVFNKDTLAYNVSIPNNATEIVVNASQNDSKAKVEITGNKNLKVGDNLVSVKVTAEDGSVKTYTINVNRAEEKKPEVVLDSDATLSKLDMSGYTLTPAFNKNTNVYSINVGGNVDGLNVVAIPNSDKAKVEVVGNTGWKYGVNNVSIIVTAENGNKNTYIVNVNRKSPQTTTVSKKSNDSYLSELVVAGADISPKFNKDTSSYNIVVPYEMEKLNITYKTNNSKAKVEILNNDNLLVDFVNTVQVKVTAEDGSVRIYTINAKRSAQKSNADLKSLVVRDFNISPAFSKNNTNYAVTVKAGTDKIDIDAIPENSKAKVEIIGNTNLKPGKNTVLIKVTDENNFNKIYQIEVEKPTNSIFGMAVAQFIMYLALCLCLLGLIFLLLYYLRKSKEKTPALAGATTATPVIEFKPEFNFGSKNGTDDDTVYGNFNQGVKEIPTEQKKVIDYNVQDADFDYDETITKDELIRAIREGMETKNADKLKLLLKQDEINQLKKEMKRKESQRRDRL